MFLKINLVFNNKEFVKCFIFNQIKKTRAIRIIIFLMLAYKSFDIYQKSPINYLAFKIKYIVEYII
jgi:hypothetical protein